MTCRLSGQWIPVRELNMGDFNGEMRCGSVKSMNGRHNRNSIDVPKCHCQSADDEDKGLSGIVDVVLCSIDVPIAYISDDFLANAKRVHHFSSAKRSFDHR